LEGLMARTYQNLVDEAREILQDTDAEAYRWTTDTLRNKLNRGLQELGRLRPDAFYATFAVDDIVVPEVEDADLTDSFPLSMQFYPPLVYWVTGSAELIEDEFTNDARAGILLAQFKQMILSL
jgi:hypothetical protein